MRIARASDTVRPDAGLGGSGVGTPTLVDGSAGGIVCFRMVGEADARFYESGQSLHVQAGKSLLPPALGVLNLGPPGLPLLINCQS